MQGRQGFSRPPPVDSETITEPLFGYTQPATGVRDMMDDRLMDAIHRVLKKIKEENIPPPPPPAAQMFNYEARKEDLGLTFAEEQSLIERITKKVEERISISLDMRIKNLIDGLFETGEYVLKSSSGQQDENKIVKMDVIHSGAKRKADLSVDQVVHVSGVPKKALDEDWSCTLCQVVTTSQHGLNDHIKGKKHKLNEAAMRLKNERKIFNNGQSIHKKAKLDRSSNLCETKQKSVFKTEEDANEFTSTGVAVIAGEDWSCAICQFSAISKQAFDEHLQGEQHKSKETDLRLEAVKNQDKGLLKKEDTNQRENDMIGNSKGKTIIGADQKKSKTGKRKTLIWCSICCVGVTSEVAMEMHKKGKTHIKLLKNLPIQDINRMANTGVDAEYVSLKLDDTVVVTGGMDVDTKVESETVPDLDVEYRDNSSLKRNDTDNDDDGVVGVKDVDAKEEREDNELRDDDTDGVVGVMDMNTDGESEANIVNNS